MFNGLDKNVESIVYDFSGCTVKISKTDDNDKFEVNINPGPFEFDIRKMECKRDKYALEVSWSDCDWWINAPVGGLNHFKNGDRFTIEDINKILLNVKGGVESRSIKTDVCKIKLMTREEMLDLLYNSELLPSEICKKKDDMITTLDESIEYERKEKNNNLVEILDERHTFDFCGVKVTTKPVDGGLFKLNIDSNGYNLKDCNVGYINNNVYVHFFKSCENKYDWYFETDPKIIPDEDLLKFDSDGWRFDNGIELTRKGIQIIVTCIKNVLEETVKYGCLTKEN